MTRNPASRLPPPPNLRASAITVEDVELVVLSYPLESPSLPSSLTAAEVDVANRILAGATNREIAESRGSSERTVANQVAALLRKLGVSGRGQIGRALRTHPSSEPSRGPARDADRVRQRVDRRTNDHGCPTPPGVFDPST